MSAVSEVVYATPSLPPGEERRIHPNAVRPSDVLVLIGSAVSAFALVWLLYTQIAPFSGTLGFVLIWFVTFIAMYWICERELEGPLIAADRTMGVLLGSVAIGLLIPLISIVGFVFYKGWQFLSLHFLTNDLAGTGPLAPGSSGGAAHAIVGTLEQVGLAVIISVPVGIATAVYMNEVEGPPDAGRAHVRERNERHSVDRRRAVHLRRLDHPVPSDLLGLRSVAGALDPDAADRDPHLGGGAAARPGRPPRGLARPGIPGVADDLVGGAADRAQRPDHRRHPRCGARRG